MRTNKHTAVLCPVWNWRGGYPTVHFWPLVEIWCLHARAAHLLPRFR